MVDSSQVHLNHKFCLVCGELYPDSVLIHKSLSKRHQLAPNNEYGFCPEHQKIIDEGKVFLTEVTNQCEDTTTQLSLVSAQKTGRVIAVSKEFMLQLSTNDEIPEYSFISQELFNEVVESFKKSQEVTPYGI